MILTLLLAAAQADRLPPANPLPPPGTEEAAVMAPITTILRGMEVGDPALILSAVIPEGAITAARTGPDGARQRRIERWAEFAARFKGDGRRIVETLGRPAIEVDADVAMVWAPYTVTIDGKLSHCGYDLFDLVRGDAGWKVLNITYSHRTTGCTAR